ncbi:glycoside hydrolase family 108 protein [Sphingomonas parapaucimobilis]|uniref:Uncharacterized protein n=1 Tax=Sphingomonas parapaucimobilis NBRC 15100 TaxID=1219049 RepID=A0A0A1W699_9SPHN|nr:glycosyl hydrolase 108 family protein [Sphingomonas parapaucimobilis]GAM00702.1 hypothetical protein SP5_035_01020 [Sphingomonas parapaucimobilis NBRC 15100]
MKTIDQLIDEVIAREGDYSNHPADRGGPTRFGITEQVGRANGYTGDMRVFPRQRAEAIYRAIYWTRPSFDQVAAYAPVIAAELFDTGINMGVGVASTFLQRALNALNRGAVDYPDIKVDGQIGAMTIYALRLYLAKRGDRAELVMLRALEALQGERYIKLTEDRPANEAFLFGWLSERIGQAA